MPLAGIPLAERLRPKSLDEVIGQRHLRIGYNRAARLLEQMENSGLVGALAANGSRELIVPKRDE